MSRRSRQEKTENLLDSDVCHKCGGYGYILSEDGEGRFHGITCECLRKELDERRLRFANLPPAFRDMKLKTFNAAIYRQPDSRDKINVACRIIKRYLDNFDEMEKSGMGLYLYSREKGSGKTRMAASIVNELLTRGKLVKFATSTAVLKEIKDSWNGEGEYTESRLLDQLVVTDIFVIDDFGTEKVADWINDKFYHIVNERYIRKKVTIFTSNNALDQLDYDSRITSRIRETTYQIAFPEESVRDRIAEQKAQNMVSEI